MSKFPENLFDPGSPISFVIKHLGVVPYRMNELLVFLDKAPVSDDPESFESATNVKLDWFCGPCLNLVHLVLTVSRFRQLTAFVPSHRTATPVSFPSTREYIQLGGSF